MDCHFLLQGIFLTQESNLSLLRCRQMPYPLSHQGSLEVELALLESTAEGALFSGLQTSNTHTARPGGAVLPAQLFPHTHHSHRECSGRERPAVLPDGDLSHAEEQIQWKRGSPPSRTLTVHQGLCLTCHLHDLNDAMK